MRPVERIEPVLATLRDYWYRNPDLRLGQVIVNATPRAFGGDPFYVEDDVLVEQLQAMLITNRRRS